MSYTTSAAQAAKILICEDPVPLDLGIISSTEHTVDLGPIWETLGAGNFRASDILSSERQQSTPSLAVIIHCFWLESLERVLQKLQRFRSVGLIVITTDSEEKAAEIQRLLTIHKASTTQSRIIVTPNRGRDVLPFWISLRDCTAGFDYFLKLHLKKSPHADQHFPQSDGMTVGEAWTEDLYRCLLPESDQEMSSLLHEFCNAELAAVYPRPWPPLARHGWGDKRNKKQVASILSACEVSPYMIFAPLIYPVGNMFYGRVSSFLEFTNTFIDTLDYPTEPIEEDGTILHAIERCYTFLLTARGLNTACLFPPSRERVGSKERLVRKLRIFPLSSTNSDGNRQQPEQSSAYTKAAAIHDFYEQTISTTRLKLATCEMIVDSYKHNRLTRIWSRLRHFLGREELE